MKWKAAKDEPKESVVIPAAEKTRYMYDEKDIFINIF
jgi:hypothetical protein